MTAIPHAALALTRAFGRFEHVSSRVLEAATGDGDVGQARADLLAAKTQVAANVAVMRIADSMYDALLELGAATVNQTWRRDRSAASL